MRAWHFVGKTLRDGRPVPKDGKLLRFNGAPILCGQGLHASLQPFDALQYAPGETLCLVECAGRIVHGDDKLVCTKRTIIVRMNAKPLLRYFARQQALSVIHLWNPPQIVLDYLMGDDAACDAAMAAAWDAARAAAMAAAMAAARAAAMAAAMAAARDAAMAAARDAAWDAARAAAWDAAWDAAMAAARTAAWDAARAAARAAARKSFNALVYDAFADWLED